MTHTTTRQGDGTILLTPTNSSLQSATVIICHGLGDTSEGFYDVAQRLSSKLPHAKFVLPTAPTQKVTMNMGMAMPSWYDIVGLDKRSNEFCKGIEESRSRLHRLVQTEVDAGVSHDRIALAGFSQGGALSLYAGMQLPKPPAGIVVMSGYLPHESGFKITAGSEGTPIWHGHGEVDPLVKMQFALESERVAKRMGATNYTFKSYAGLAHSVNPAEITDVLSFLEKVLPPDDSCRIKLKDPSEMSIKELKGAIAKGGLGRLAIGLYEKREYVDLVRRHQEGKL
mmetsp:Transcript_7104/g.13235  ORF Transcript_7104/g.13235 Transcript_7104/m.13235 type:complete len:283 (+) Transcript_7104:161-1009(+)|eukprot:CAMPEP_0201618528 /NCGR_PEP_ID=MMETSP0492-20130828/39211_1 /ASSEMBLY_ACC=CAM_ASM_000837 /TAXON_ID=420259 /ORGANISM="Thalassiosira gravida, Strain GMp14c1" /LENGTH=282 /DNA_ID=CAMNT_0048087147 /DNA_START=61 /DNA_END=909 /DNA_ORIENTATION=+